MTGSDSADDSADNLKWVDLPSRSTFQSSNPIGQNIIHNYMRICTVALTTP